MWEKADEGEREFKHDKAGQEMMMKEKKTKPTTLKNWLELLWLKKLKNKEEKETDLDQLRGWR